MAQATKLKHSLKRKKTPGKVDKSVGNYEKHPFFIKKANEAKTLLKKVGLPKKTTKSE
jgi:hypothetical protein